MQCPLSLCISDRLQRKSPFSFFSAMMIYIVDSVIGYMNESEEGEHPPLNLFD